MFPTGKTDRKRGVFLKGDCNFFLTGILVDKLQRKIWHWVAPIFILLVGHNVHLEGTERVILTDRHCSCLTRHLGLWPCRMLKMIRIHVSVAYMGVSPTQTRVARLWALNLFSGAKLLIYALLVHLLCWNFKFTVFTHFVFTHYFRPIRYINSGSFTMYAMQLQACYQLQYYSVMNDF